MTLAEMEAVAKAAHVCEPLKWVRDGFQVYGQDADGKSARLSALMFLNRIMPPDVVDHVRVLRMEGVKEFDLTQTTEALEWLRS